MILKTQLLNKLAKLPSKNYPSDAGIDIFPCLRQDIIVRPGKSKLIPTGIAVEIPEGYCLVLKDRSGMAVKRGLHILAGVIDSHYRGEVKVCVYNTIDAIQYVKHDQAVAQGLLLPVPHIEIQQAETLSSTDRDNKGFGSSDKS